MASERDQAALFLHIGLPASLADVPWPFLPKRGQDQLSRLVRVSLLDEGKDEE